MPDFKQALKEWMNKNPVRSFRGDNGLSIFACAAALGVTTTSIQSWESGTATPTDENMDKIARLTGNSNVAATWKEWSEARPQLNLRT